jgi:protein required for attachment to host cells
MTKVAIPNGALVFVGDGRKALFLRNDGDEAFPNLTTEHVFLDKNPSTHAQGTDRPGRAFQAAGNHARSSVAQTDWHELEEHQFADRVAAVLERLVRQEKIKALVIVAPPKTLADLRGVLHADVKARVVAELNKDLTNHPVYEIEKHLVREPR